MPSSKIQCNQLLSLKKKKEILFPKMSVSMFGQGLCKSAVLNSLVHLAAVQLGERRLGRRLHINIYTSHRGSEEWPRDGAGSSW